MASGKHKVSVGVFDSHAKAQQAVNELRRMGFREDQIGVAGKHTEDITGALPVADAAKGSGAGMAAGAATGAGLGALWGLGILAGVLPAIGPAIAGGTLATILSSAGAGAAALGLLGALTGLGLSSEEADFYESEFKAGRVLVTVTSDERYDEVSSTLRRLGAYDMTSPTTKSSVSCPTSVSTTSVRVPVTEEQVHLDKTAVKEKV